MNMDLLNPVLKPQGRNSCSSPTQLCGSWSRDPVFLELALPGPWLGKANVPIHLFHFNQRISSTDLATVEASNFQLDRKTRFIIHGFIDKGEESWLTDMCQVGPRPGHSPLRPAPGTQLQTLSRSLSPRLGTETVQRRMLLPKNSQETLGSPERPLSSSPEPTKL